VLYERLGQPEEAPAAWQRFLELEADTPRAWLVRNGLIVVREENITNTPFGPENMPAWSPDGKKLAFARGWDWNVWVRDLETGEEHFVTTSGLNDLSLDWSPDGGWLLYTKRDEHYTQADLWCAPADGQGEEKPLTQMGTAKLGRWLANGERIYFDAAGGTFLMNGDASSPAVGWDDREMDGPWPAKQPGLSSDGQKAAFYRGEPAGEGQIMLYEQWGEWDKCRALTPDSGRYHYPTFSPDGRFVLFSGRQGTATFDLFVVPADGSRRLVRLLRCNYEADWGPQARWSPDGRRVAFPRPVFGDLWIATLGGVKRET
jgi:Tol biopolymer transport system component